MTRLRRSGVAPWLAVSSAMFTVAWGGNEFTPLLIMYRQIEQLDAVTVFWLLGAYVFGIVPALLLGGPLSDRFGRRPLMLPAPLVAIAGSLILAFASGAPALLFVGRVVSGISIGLAMAVGSSWVKELSTSPFDQRADAGAGARRAAMALTGGFGAGSIAGALLAQFSPIPVLAPYLVHTIVSAASLALAWRAPESFQPSTTRPSLVSDLAVPSATRIRFLLIVVPMAPWVFGIALAAQAVLSGLMLGRVGGYDILYSGVAGLITLAFGFLAQGLGRRIDSPRSARGVIVGLLLSLPALGLASFAAAQLGPVTVLVSAALLGIAYGVLLVSGLQEVQRMARPDDLAGLTAVYYALTYLGFFVPVLMSVLAPWISYPAMFAGAMLLVLVPLGLAIVFSKVDLADDDGSAMLQ